MIFKFTPKTGRILQIPIGVPLEKQQVQPTLPTTTQTPSNPETQQQPSGAAASHSSCALPLRVETRGAWSYELHHGEVRDEWKILTMYEGRCIGSMYFAGTRARADRLLIETAGGTNPKDGI